MEDGSPFTMSCVREARPRHRPRSGESGFTKKWVEGVLSSACLCAARRRSLPRRSDRFRCEARHRSRPPGGEQPLRDARPRPGRRSSLVGAPGKLLSQHDSCFSRARAPRDADPPP